MKLPNKYGYGTLFGFSGLEGENSKNEDFIGMTMSEPITVRFDSAHPVSLFIPADGDSFEFILSDVIKSDKALLAFADCESVVGRSESAPSVFGDFGRIAPSDGETAIFENDGFFFALSRSGEAFSLCRKKSAEAAFEASKEKLLLDLEALTERRLDYFRRFPECPKPEFERLYYKCLSINKVNVYSPQNGIPFRWTTPDRLPHRQMWLWDSMFHSMAIVNYDPDLAKEAILSVLECRHDDGFIPHMMKSRNDTSSITQPQVIAWACLDYYKKTGDTDFLRETEAKISKYLLWFLENRDLNSNGLLEWETDFSNVRCRCDESGMDNSPRFDTTERLDAIDASCFMVHDCRCLAKIYRILGKNDEALRFDSIADSMSKKINELLWDDELGAYTDRTFSGKLTGVLSVCSFLPLFAGVATPERAKRLVALLKDETRFGAPLPVPSISRDNPDYGTDMWRGPVWLNFNYMVIQGLKRYGFLDLADEIKRKTLFNVLNRFEETGNVFEFYDPEEKLVPWNMNRKGEQPSSPDYRKKLHAITDYNWSACFTYLLITE